MIDSLKYSKIYLIDDFGITNFFHEKLLQKLNIESELRKFTNPEKALEDLRSDLGITDTILIFLDINMPQLDGFQFLDILKKQFASRDIDVVIVSSSIWETDKERARQYPEMVMDFISKPMNYETLRTLFKRVSDSPKNKISIDT